MVRAILVAFLVHLALVVPVNALQDNRPVALVRQLHVLTLKLMQLTAEPAAMHVHQGKHAPGVNAYHNVHQGKLFVMILQAVLTTEHVNQPSYVGYLAIRECHYAVLPIIVTQHYRFADLHQTKAALDLHSASSTQMARQQTTVDSI